MQSAIVSDRIELLNFIRDKFQSDLKQDVLRGLLTPQKSLPCRYFYDARGSQLFEQICCLPEYYQTRTELSILRDSAQAIVQGLRRADIIELGSGSDLKIRVLLDAVMRNCPDDIRYMPVDVSESALGSSAAALVKAYPGLRITGIIADFTKYGSWIKTGRRKLFLFFGSTVGNFSDQERTRLLRSISGAMGHDDRLLLGIDMIKPVEIMKRAYNDTQGKTAEFNRNILDVINRELNAEFNKEHFDHLAFYDPARERIEMHLRANRSIVVDVRDLGVQVAVEKDETIRTEICRKFSRESAIEMAKEGGLKIDRWFSDSRGWFSLILLEKQ